MLLPLLRDDPGGLELLLSAALVQLGLHPLASSIRLMPPLLSDHTQHEPPPGDALTQLVLLLEDDLAP